MSYDISRIYFIQYDTSRSIHVAANDIIPAIPLLGPYPEKKYDQKGYMHPSVC